ncbi:MAG: virulence factor [Bryobacteraceae bacterium]
MTVELPAKFMERIDRLAVQQGLQGSDDYLAQWRWSEEEEREGSAREVAEAVRAELEARATW